MKYARIETLRPAYPIALMCRVMEVSESGYHAWRQRSPSRRAAEEGRLETEIAAAHRRTRATFGPERLQADLRDHGIRVGLHRIKRIRRKLGLRCCQHRKFRVTTNSKHSLPVAPNVLKQQFKAQAPAQAWVSDITYIPTDEGWLYLAGIKDLFNGELVGYAMQARMTETLVTQALLQAVISKRPAAGLIHHSDRGSQYCARAYQTLVRQLGMIPSMSRKGNCYERAACPRGTMCQWKASGEPSKMNSLTTGALQLAVMQKRKSRSTSRFFITACGNRNA